MPRHYDSFSRLHSTALSGKWISSDDHETIFVEHIPYDAYYRKNRFRLGFSRLPDFYHIFRSELWLKRYLRDHHCYRPDSPPVKQYSLGLPF